jgi:hypothetical protein
VKRMDMHACLYQYDVQSTANTDENACSVSRHKARTQLAAKQYGGTAGHKNIQQEQAGAFADLRNTPRRRRTYNAGVTEVREQSGRCTVSIPTPEVQKPTGEELQVSANRLALQVPESAQVTGVLPSASGPVTQCQRRHPCYLLPTRCACTKPRTACRRARTEQGANNAGGTLPAAPRSVQAYTARTRKAAQAARPALPSVNGRLLPDHGPQATHAHPKRQLRARGTCIDRAGSRLARRPMRGAGGEALDVGAAEGAERRLLAELAQAQRAVDTEPVAAAAHRHVQRLVQTDACARARPPGRGPGRQARWLYCGRQRSIAVPGRVTGARLCSPVPATHTGKTGSQPYGAETAIHLTRRLPPLSSGICPQSARFEGKRGPGATFLG